MPAPQVAHTDSYPVKRETLQLHVPIGSSQHGTPSVAGQDSTEIAFRPVEEDQATLVEHSSSFQRER